MLYHIDYEHFLVDMIDFFTKEEIQSFVYVNISTMITQQTSNYSDRIGMWLPDGEIEMDLAVNEDIVLADESYYNQLKIGLDTPRNDQSTRYLWYQYIVGPLRNHANVMVVCMRRENHYAETFCRFVKNNFDFDAIDLNKLFTEGRVGDIYIDFDKFKKKSEQLHDDWKEYNHQHKSQTREGREELINLMSKKEKLKQLKALGIPYIPVKEKDITKLLKDSWVNGSI